MCSQWRRVTCAFSFRECNHTRRERTSTQPSPGRSLTPPGIAPEKMENQRKWKTREGYPGSDLTWVLVSVTLFSCKQQAVTLVFKAPHHFWWAVSKQKQGSIPEPKRTQVVLRWHARARTHTHNLQASCHYTYDCPHPIPTVEPSPLYGDSCTCCVPRGENTLVNSTDSIPQFLWLLAQYRCPQIECT